MPPSIDAPAPVRAIDINSDVGEAATPIAQQQENALMKHITSVNIACGGHAGSPQQMAHVLEQAKALGLAVGAHPSYPDKEHFGRKELNLPLPAIEQAIAEQTHTLCVMADRYGLAARHIKLHGALAHRAASDKEVARALFRAIGAVDKTLVVLAMAGTNLSHWAQEEGLAAVEEAFFDRAYEDDGTLVAREQEGAVITDETIAAARLKIMLAENVLLSQRGKKIPARIDSICIHGDTPNAVPLVQACRAVLDEAGIAARPFADAS